jgi:hypothetical protein
MLGGHGTVACVSQGDNSVRNTRLSLTVAYCPFDWRPLVLTQAHEQCSLSISSPASSHPSQSEPVAKKTWLT